MRDWNELLEFVDRFDIPSDEPCEKCGLCEDVRQVNFHNTDEILNVAGCASPNAVTCGEGFFVVPVR